MSTSISIRGQNYLRHTPDGDEYHLTSTSKKSPTPRHFPHLLSVGITYLGVSKQETVQKKHLIYQSLALWWLRMQEGEWRGLEKNLVQPVPKRILESTAKITDEENKIEQHWRVSSSRSVDLRKTFRAIQKALQGHEKVIQFLSNIVDLLSNLCTNTRTLYIHTSETK
jgi:hypothetical protein